MTGVFTVEFDKGVRVTVTSLSEVAALLREVGAVNGATPTGTAEPAAPPAVVEVPPLTHQERVEAFYKGTTPKVQRGIVDALFRQFPGWTSDRDLMAAVGIDDRGDLNGALGALAKRAKSVGLDLNTDFIDKRVKQSEKGSERQRLYHYRLTDSFCRFMTLTEGAATQSGATSR